MELGDIIYGRLREVGIQRAGTELNGDHAGGATVLNVFDTSEFDDEGGLLDLEELDGTLESYTYLTKDDDALTITLATPLTQAYGTDEYVYSSPAEYYKVAKVMPDGDTGDWIEARVSVDLDDKLDDGIYDGADEKQVEVREVINESGVGGQVEYQLTNILNERAVVYGYALDPETMPEGGPVELPPVSPTPETRLGPAAAILTWTAVVGLRYEIHVSDVNTTPPTPGGPTLHSEAAGPDSWIYNLPDGSLLSTETQNFAALIAKNSADEAAPPSPWIPILAGNIPPEYLQILAGEVIAKAMNTEEFRAETIHGVSLDVAGILLNAMDGLFVPSTTPGKPRLQVPLDPAQAIQILAYLEAVGALFNGNVTIRGLTNFLHGLMTLGNGVTDPSTPPTVSGTYPKVDTGLVDDDDSVLMRGLTQRIGTAGDWTSVMSVPFVGAAIRTIDKTTGGLWPFYDTSSWGGQFLPDGGIVAIGSNYYVAGKDFSGSRNGDWWVKKLDSSFVLVSEARLWSGASLDRNPAIGTDGTNVLIAYTTASTPVTLRLRIYPTSEFAGGGTASPTVVQDLLTTNARLHIGGVYKGTIPAGSNLILVSATSGTQYVFDGTTYARQTSKEQPRAGGTSVLGLHFDGSRFWHFDDAGHIYQYSLHNGGGGPFGYTWYDADSGGTGTAESKLSVTANPSVPRGSWPTISTPAPDDDGTTDAPNTVRVYANNIRQTAGLGATEAYPEGTRVWTFDSLLTSGSNSPTTSGFASRPAQAPGNISSSKLAAFDSQPLTRLTGDGKARMMKLVQKGDLTVSPTANTWVAVNVTFDEPFDVAPRVTPSYRPSTTPGSTVDVKVAAGSETTTGFILYVYRNANTSTAIAWQAVAY